jgi:hypothetical protein
VIEMTGTGVRAAADGFATLICAEADWLEAEFAAIVAANFRDVPGDPVRPTPPSHRDLPTPARPGRVQPTDLTRTARRVGARERSPPTEATAGG